MTTTPTVTALVTSAALRAFDEAGQDWATQARRAGVPPVLEAEFGWHVPVASAVRLYRRGLDRLGPDFVLRAAHRAPDAHRSPLGLFCRTRSDGWKALEALCEHHDLVSNAVGLSLEPDEGGAWLVFDPRAPLGPLLDYLVADTLVSATSMGTPPGALRLRVEGDPERFAALGTPTRQGSPAVFFPGQALDRVLNTDRALAALTERLLEAYRPPDATSRDRIRATLRAYGPGTTLEGVAAGLSLSPRTLHRRLAALGTTFRDEVDHLRCERALELIDTVPQDALAELLGYSDARAFRRAFRRWTGTCPSDPSVRKRNAG